eukprot:jgi/Pico_ML_1/56126/g1715.t1
MAQPKILFLDEPTSNLDSSAAHHLVTKLKDIACMKNTTIAATIHQPSERVFELTSAAEWMMDLLDDEFNGKDGVSQLLDDWEKSDHAALARVEILHDTPTFVWLRYAMYLALAVAMGPVWWQVGKDANTSDVSSITGGIFAVAGFFS